MTGLARTISRTGRRHEPETVGRRSRQAAEEEVAAVALRESPPDLAHKADRLLEPVPKARPQMVRPVT